MATAPSPTDSLGNRVRDERSIIAINDFVYFIACEARAVNVLQAQADASLLDTGLLRGAAHVCRTGQRTLQRPAPSSNKPLAHAITRPANASSALWLLWKQCGSMATRPAPSTRTVKSATSAPARSPGGPASLGQIPSLPTGATSAEMLRLAPA